MRKGKEFMKQWAKIVGLFGGLLLMYSCAEKEWAEEPVMAEGVPVQLAVSLDQAGFSSDSEIVPMDTRTTDSYVVTEIWNSTLFILKQIDNKWVLVEKEEGVVMPPSGTKLKKGELLQLTDDNKRFVLVPGTYRFLLLVNAVINKDLAQNDWIAEIPPAVTTGLPTGDFFWGQCNITLEKTEELNQSNVNPVNLALKRHSSMIRFVLGGDDYFPYNNSTIYFQIAANSEMCTGINLLGDKIIGYLNQKMDLTSEIKKEKSYLIKELNWHFSETSLMNNTLSLYADETERFIDLKIMKIEVQRGIFFFSNEHLIKDIPIQQNHMTTILIRKTGDNTISHEFISDPINGWDDAYPPFNYLELNN